MNLESKEAWGADGPYEDYVGRWSRIVAKEFLTWLEIPQGQTWSDVGCGTGALVHQILASYRPKAVYGIDRAKGFVKAATEKTRHRGAGFAIADGAALPWPNQFCDVSVSGLVLNFVPNSAAMVAEMVRTTRPNGKVAAYVWDYLGGMEMMRHFWDAAILVDSQAAALDEAERFPICQPEPLRLLFQGAGLKSVEVRSIDIPTVFRNFDDYWMPFLGRQGSAPTYLAGLNAKKRHQVRDLLKARLLPSADGSIHLTARAFAVQGIV